jgi:N-methylhydantoinase A
VADVEYQLGIDIGGTFTDLTLMSADGATHFTHKVPSTPSQPSRAVAHGVVELTERLGSNPSAIKSFVHGTTIALNAVLERRGSHTALVVSPGNRDILEIARLKKPDLFNLNALAVPALIARRDVVESGASRDQETDERQLDEIAAGIAPGIESVAVCLLHSNEDPSAEAALAEGLRRRKPELHVSCSADIWPQQREYERAMVAALNAYVQPIMSDYVDRLQNHMDGIGLTAPLYITQSNGGVLSALTAKTKPVNTLLSGPASGVVGAAYLARYAGHADAVTLDIGGTSADFSIIRDGMPVYSTEASVGDFPVVMPSVDVFAVGAGGGSIAWFDQLGVLKLGPRSAGAEPGPVCYGRGGTELTTTDAYLICNFVNPDYFVGGQMRLHRGATLRAMAEMAQRLGSTAENAAESILRLATSTMASAILPMMTKRGLDPRDFTLIAFGGAGPTHACLLAEEIGISTILIPPAPGTMCSLGAAIADFKVNYIRSFRAPMETVDSAALRTIFQDLEGQGRRWLADENPQIGGVDVFRSADMRYRGQAFDVEVAIPADIDLATLDADRLAQLFHSTYGVLYGNADPIAPIDLIALRVGIVGRRNPPPPPLLPKRQPQDEAALTGYRDIRHNGASHRAKVYRRELFRAGDVVEGPAVIEQFDTTTIVLTGFSARVDARGNVLISRG